MRDNANDDDSIIKIVNQILYDAVEKGASDIHFEPYEHIYRIRFRLDGQLYPVTTPSESLGKRITSRIKVLSQLDIAERRLPQDGRFKFAISPEQAIDVRISTCPTVYGEKVVARLLNPSTSTMNIDELGFEESQKALFLDALAKEQGLILVTGPTGSGKTVTLYTALSILNKPSINISTVEDPVEIYLPGINQVNINLKAGLTFGTVLRSFLRQDPDIMMIGEIRDLETAEIGLKAAQTGHLVLSTLHTHSASAALSRLQHMGVKLDYIAASVSLIIAQRLVRKLCPFCQQKNTMGCDQCQQGYKGRTGIYEILPISEPIRQAMFAGANAYALESIAKQKGMRSLMESGLEKVQKGITNLFEINRLGLN